MQRLKELKKSYRENYDKLKGLRGEVYYIQQSIDTLKQQLVGAFEDWFSATFEEDEATQTLPGGQKSQRTLQQTLQPDGEDEVEGRDADPDAVAFIKAKRKVDDLHKAKRQERKGLA